MLRAAANPRWASSSAACARCARQGRQGARLLSSEPAQDPSGSTLPSFFPTSEDGSERASSSASSTSSSPSPSSSSAFASRPKSPPPASEPPGTTETASISAVDLKPAQSGPALSSALLCPTSIPPHLTKAAARMKPARQPSAPSSPPLSGTASPADVLSPPSTQHDNMVGSFSQNPSSPNSSSSTKSSLGTSPRVNRTPIPPSSPSQTFQDLFGTLFSSEPSPAKRSRSRPQSKTVARPGAAKVPFPAAPPPSSAPKHLRAKSSPFPTHLLYKPTASTSIASDKSSAKMTARPGGLPRKHDGSVRAIPAMLTSKKKLLPTLLPRRPASSGSEKGPVDGSGWKAVSPTAKEAIARRQLLEQRKASLEVYLEKRRKETPPHLNFLAAGTTPITGWTTILDDQITASPPLSLEPAEDRPPVAELAHSLDRVLFNPGVHFLRDPRSNVYNFDARIRDLPHPDEFDHGRFPPYVTASKDVDLRELAKAEDCKFYGSTSTLTSCLSQIYFMIGRWKQINTSMLSSGYAEKPTNFTYGAKLPASIYLKYNPDGTYAVDNDKSYDSAGDPRLLSELGKVMEKLLTTTAKDLARFRKDAPEDAVPEEERNMREAYHYTKGAKLLMRSQLDGIDPRLPGTGSFDIKTRSTIAVRMDIENVEEGRHYQLRKLTGPLESFERERWDMMRSAFLKYSLQCRIGAMDGIFCAYHTTSTIHGFQYISVAEMDESLFNSPTMGDQNFALSVQVLEKVFEEATKLYPGKSLELTMRTPDTVRGQMAVFVQPQDWNEKDEGSPKPITELRVVAVSKVDGEACEGEVSVTGKQQWTVDLHISRDPSTSAKAQATARANFEMLRAIQTGIGSSVKLPSGLTEQEMQAVFNARWYSEVRDPNSGYAHLALEQVESWDDDADGEDEVEGLVKRVETRAGTPPPLSFANLSAETRQVRRLALEGKKREDQLREQMRGKEVEHWVQGELFADLAEEGQEEGGDEAEQQESRPE